MRLLDAAGFEVAYGAAPVVRSVTFTLAAGEIVALLGRNGMGKTTLLRGILGLAPQRGGTLRLDGRDLVALPAEKIARQGVGYVPAERGIFGSLSVRENLLMCARPDPRGDQHWTLDRVLVLFPRLAERLQHGGHNLSGGEQQMLAIGRALMTNPRLLLIDEATEGLAPLVARDIWRTVTEICTSGMTAIIVDRDVRRLARLAGRSMILFKGEIVFDGAPAQLLANTDMVQRYIGL
jgi:branched-chain amino acid transport system ATP-binding protein